MIRTRLGRARRRRAARAEAEALAAIANEYRRGLEAVASGETLSGASRFASGHGRGGRFDDL